MRLTKIKEYASLVSTANKLGQKEIKLDRDFAISLLAEINVITADRLEREQNKPRPGVLGSLNGGSFK